MRSFGDIVSCPVSCVEGWSAPSQREQQPEVHVDDLRPVSGDPETDDPVDSAIVASAPAAYGSWGGIGAALS